MNKFDYIKEKLREHFPGTLAISQLTTKEGQYIEVMYQPLNVLVQVPYCEELHIVCSSYNSILVSAIESKITFHDSSINTLEHLMNNLKDNRKAY